MPDQAIAGALAQRIQLETKLAECDAKIKRLRAQLAETNKFIAQWEKFSGQSAFDLENNPSRIALTKVSQNGADSKIRERVRNPKKEVIAKVVAEILDQNAAPMSRAEIFKALKDRGIHISGNDPEMVLSTMLWRAGEHYHIERIKGGGYWFSDRLVTDDDLSPSSENDHDGPNPDDEHDAMVENQISEVWQDKNR